MPLNYGRLFGAFSRAMRDAPPDVLQDLADEIGKAERVAGADVRADQSSDWTRGENEFTAHTGRQQAMSGGGASRMVDAYSGLDPNAANSVAIGGLADCYADVASRMEAVEKALIRLTRFVVKGDVADSDDAKTEDTDDETTEETEATEKAALAGTSVQTRSLKNVMDSLLQPHAVANAVDRRRVATPPVMLGKANPLAKAELIEEVLGRLPPEYSVHFHSRLQRLERVRAGTLNSAALQATAPAYNEVLRAAGLN